MDVLILGQVLAATSALAFSFANVFISKTSASRGDKGVLFSVVVTLCFSFALWLLLEGAERETWRFDRAELTGLGLFAAAGVTVMVFGRNLLFASVRRLGVSRATSVKRLNPFFSVILAVVILGEPMWAMDVIGIVLIAVAFGLLMLDSYRSGKLSGAAPPLASYSFGILAALAYASTYILRKLGLMSLPEPALGTFVSAASGLLALAAFGAFSRAYRDKLLNMFAYLDRWIILSAIAVSIGQILLFAALAFEKVSTVAVIASLEIFVSIFLSVVIFRTESRISLLVALSAVLAFSGAIFLASS